jgi:hypothetical protein
MLLDLIWSQPALLYLVPACLLSTVLVGSWKQDLHHLWAYDEAKLYEDAKKELSQRTNDASQAPAEMNPLAENCSDQALEDKKER